MTISLRSTSSKDLPCNGMVVLKTPLSVIATSASRYGILWPRIWTRDICKPMENCPFVDELSLKHCHGFHGIFFFASGYFELKKPMFGVRKCNNHLGNFWQPINIWNPAALTCQEMSTPGKRRNKRRCCSGNNPWSLVTCDSSLPQLVWNMMGYDRHLDHHSLRSSNVAN